MLRNGIPVPAWCIWMGHLHLEHNGMDGFYLGVGVTGLNALVTIGLAIAVVRLSTET